MNKSEYAVYIAKETVLESIVKDTFTFGFLVFCVYVSQDSQWWTFLTGSMFIFFLFGKVMSAMGKSKKFTSKEDLQKWVDSLD